MMMMMLMLMLMLILIIERRWNSLNKESVNKKCKINFLPPQMKHWIEMKKESHWVKSTIASWLYNNMKAHSMTLFRKWKSMKMWDFRLLLTMWKTVNEWRARSTDTFTSLNTWDDKNVIVRKEEGNCQMSAVVRSVTLISHYILLVRSYQVSTYIADFSDHRSFTS